MTEDKVETVDTAAETKQANETKPEARKVKVMVGTGIVTAEVVRENDLTMWVRLADGEVIKRHKRKHLR